MCVPGGEELIGEVFNSVNRIYCVEIQFFVLFLLQWLDGGGDLADYFPLDPDALQFLSKIQGKLNIFRDFIGINLSTKF